MAQFNSVNTDKIYCKSSKVSSLTDRLHFFSFHKPLAPKWG